MNHVTNITTIGVYSSDKDLLDIFLDNIMIGGGIFCIVDASFLFFWGPFHPKISTQTSITNLLLKNDVLLDQLL